MPALRITSPNASPGFTLVELLMAMLIMTIGLLGLLQSVNVAYEHNVRNKLREAALQVSEEQMNELRMKAPTSSTYLNVSTVVRVVAGATKKFTVTRECRPVSSTKRLRVTVGWSFRNSSTTHTIYSMKNI